MQSRPDLPMPWVRKIFQKLAVVYGRDFLSRWEGQDMEAVMADWAHELAGFANQPEAIAHALTHLPPDKPPTVLQFRGLCNSTREKGPLALPAPETRPTPEMLAKADAIKTSQQAISPKAWAWALKAREERGSGLTRAQREMWRTALADVLTAEAA